MTRSREHEGVLDEGRLRRVLEAAGVAVAGRNPERVLQELLAQYRENERRRVELERSIRELEATAEIGRVIGGETRLDRVLELIAGRSRSLVEASGVLILLSEGDELTVAATAGNVPRELTGVRMPARRSAAGRVLASGEP